MFGLDIPLMRLVNVLKSAAAEGYGPERRVILLHGPVGSSKSTIARRPEAGIEDYSRTPRGALHLHVDQPGGHGAGRDGRGRRPLPRPMHEEPLRIIPQEWATAR